MAMTTVTVARTMVGTVTAQQGQYGYVVTCDDAPAHLQTLNFHISEMKGAVVGDRVRVVYVTTPSFGLWKVSEVLR